MRLYITDEKDEIIYFLYDFLSSKLNNREVSFRTNGRTVDGVVDRAEFDDEELKWIKLFIGEQEIFIPFNNKSIVRLDKGLYYFETDSHTTLIYL